MSEPPRESRRLVQLSPTSLVGLPWADPDGRILVGVANDESTGNAVSPD